MNDVVEFLKNSLGQDWKEEIKHHPPPPPVQHDDFLDMEYSQKEEPKKEEVDFFASDHTEPEAPSQ